MADFPVVFTVSIIMIRLRYIIESCQSFQTVLFSGLRNISLRFFALSVEFGTKAVACCVKGYHHHRLLHLKAFRLTKSPLFGAACIEQASSYLEGAEQAPLRACTKQ